MEKIKLTQGKYALVDDEDFEELSKHKWCLLVKKNTLYARRQKNHKNIRMHRQILHLTSPNILVDHINGNGLDNRRENLRICTHSQNCRNRRISSINKCGVKGVTKYKDQWKATIFINKKQCHLGYYDNKRDAGKAYDKKAKEVYGEFAYLNFN